MTANLASSSVESSTPSKSISKASEHRRITKPIMEKKRRARINNSLNELKMLILNALNKDPSRHSKLEKADILEMTVRHLQKLQRQQNTVAAVNDPNVLNKYRAGYSECANEVSRFVTAPEMNLERNTRQRILSHLNHCVNNLNHLASNAQFGSATLPKPAAFPGMLPPGSATSTNPLHVQIPMHSTAAQNNLMMSLMAAAANNNNNNNAAHDINNNSAAFLNPNLCASPDLLLGKAAAAGAGSMQLSTPPSSASSTSSHFAFSLHSPASSSVLSKLNSELFYRKPMLCSPGSNSMTSSGQFSPANSDDMDMAVDLAMGGRDKHADDDENVWRPW